MRVLEIETELEEVRSSPFIKCQGERFHPLHTSDFTFLIVEEAPLLGLRCVNHGLSTVGVDIDLEPPESQRAFEHQRRGDREAILHADRRAALVELRGNLRRPEGVHREMLDLPGKHHH